MPKEHLGAVDVADPGEEPLVHEEGADRHPASGHLLPRPQRVGVRPNRVGSDFRHGDTALLLGEHLACRRPAQLGMMRRVLQPKSDEPALGRCLALGDAPLAE